MRLTWLWMWVTQPQVTSTLALLHRQHCGKPQWDNHCDSLACSSHSLVVLWPPSSFYFISQGTFHLGLTENRFIHCFTSEKRKPHNARIPLCTCINTHDCAKTSESWSFLPTNLWPHSARTVYTSTRGQYLGYRMHILSFIISAFFDQIAPVQPCTIACPQIY